MATEGDSRRHVAFEQFLVDVVRRQLLVDKSENEQGKLPEDKEGDCGYDAAAFSGDRTGSNEARCQINTEVRRADAGVFLPHQLFGIAKPTKDGDVEKPIRKIEQD